MFVCFAFVLGFSFLFIVGFFCFFKKSVWIFFVFGWLVGFFASVEQARFGKKMIINKTFFKISICGMLAK